MQLAYEHEHEHPPPPPPTCRSVWSRLPLPPSLVSVRNNEAAKNYHRTGRKSDRETKRTLGRVDAVAVAMARRLFPHLCAPLRPPARPSVRPSIKMPHTSVSVARILSHNQSRAISLRIEASSGLVKRESPLGRARTYNIMAFENRLCR